MIDALVPVRCLSLTPSPLASGIIRWREPWAKTEGEGVAVGLLDGPFDEEHPDLVGANLIVRHFCRVTGARQEAHRTHGTCSVTTLVGQGHRIVRGIVPRASLRVAIVVSHRGTATDTAVVKALDWLDAEGVRLVIIPLGGSRASSVVRVRIHRAAEAGTFFSPLTAAGCRAPRFFLRATLESYPSPRRAIAGSFCSIPPGDRAPISSHPDGMFPLPSDKTPQGE
jgi:Subtilase family